VPSQLARAEERRSGTSLWSRSILFLAELPNGWGRTTIKEDDVAAVPTLTRRPRIEVRGW
jgi:hypothetical protein